MLFGLSYFVGLISEKLKRHTVSKANEIFKGFSYYTAQNIVVDVSEIESKYDP